MLEGRRSHLEPPISEPYGRMRGEPSLFIAQMRTWAIDAPPSGFYFPARRTHRGPVAQLEEQLTFNQ